MAARQPKALVIGVGAESGLGAALAKRFAREGRHVILAGRTPERLDKVAASIAAMGGRAESFRADAADEADIIALFDRAMRDDESEPADLIVFNAGNTQPHDFRTMPMSLVEETWRTGCFGGFRVGREAARRLTPLGRGTVIFTGSNVSLFGRPNFAAAAAAKFGLRALAQAMAREFGPQGLHIAHVILDGGIDGERLNTRYPQRRAEIGPNGLLNIDAIAEAYWQIHRQPPSTWTHETDLRPFKQSF